MSEVQSEAHRAQLEAQKVLEKSEAQTKITQLQETEKVLREQIKTLTEERRDIDRLFKETVDKFKAAQEKQAQLFRDHTKKQQDSLDQLELLVGEKQRTIDDMKAKVEVAE